MKKELREGKIVQIKETPKKMKKEHLDTELILKKLEKEKKSLLDERRAAIVEVKSLEDQVTNLNQEPLAENNNVIDFSWSSPLSRRKHSWPVLCALRQQLPR